MLINARAAARPTHTLTGRCILLLTCGLLAQVGCSAETVGDSGQGGNASTAGGSGGTLSGAGTSSGGTQTAGTNAGGTAGTVGSAGQAAGGTAGAAGGTGGAGGAAGGAGGAAGAGGTLVIPEFTGGLTVIDYSPYRDGQAPGGGQQPSEQQVREDLELLAQIATGIRIYGTDGGNAHVPALCDELGLDLHVGAWIDGLASDGPNVTALANLVNEGHPSIKTAVVGNEVLNRTEDNGLVEADLLAFVAQARSEITADVTIAVAETYPRWMEMRPNLAEAVDMIIWHTYGWWSGADIEDASALVYSRYQDMLAAYPGKPMVLGETGWPTMIDHMSTDMTSTAVGSEENQWKYYREILALVEADGLEAWPFAAFDENWKATSGEGQVGAHWGIFNADRTPKLTATQLLMMAEQN
jgi:exo-beta-1,3-glucanase (GH17 family)